MDPFVKANLTREILARTRGVWGMCAVCAGPVHKEHPLDECYGGFLQRQPGGLPFSCPICGLMVLREDEDHHWVCVGAYNGEVKDVEICHGLPHTAELPPPGTLSGEPGTVTDGAATYAVLSPMLPSTAGWRASQGPEVPTPTNLWPVLPLPEFVGPRDSRSSSNDETDFPEESDAAGPCDNETLHSFSSHGSCGDTPVYSTNDEGPSFPKVLGFGEEARALFPTDD